MQAQLDEEYKERLSNAPLPCEAAQHKQCKKERKMGKVIGFNQGGGGRVLYEHLDA